MHVALIPPTAELKRFCKDRPFHLLLSHLLGIPEYRDFYLGLKLDRALLGYTTFYSLDNSAHEHGSGDQIENLLKWALEIDADEIVIPDQLFNSTVTINQAKLAHRDMLLSHHGIQNLEPLQRMYVPQGTTFEQYRYCAQRLVEEAMEFEYQLSVQVREMTARPCFTLGVSKDYEDFPGGLPRVLEDVILPLKQDSGCEIHLLGWGRNLTALSTIARHCGSMIRSTDSAKPLVFAMQNIDLSSTRAPKYPRRPSNYFDSTLGLSQRQLSIAMTNIRVFEQAAHGADVSHLEGPWDRQLPEPLWLSKKQLADQEQGKKRTF